MTISPFFLASLLKSIKCQVDQDDYLQLYGFWIKNYKDSVFSVYYHVVFLIRRLSISASIHLLEDCQYIQSIICILSCFTVIHILGCNSFDTF